jgi:hypothetical protein
VENLKLIERTPRNTGVKKHRIAASLIMILYKSTYCKEGRERSHWGRGGKIIRFSLSQPTPSQIKNWIAYTFVGTSQLSSIPSLHYM